MLEQWLFDLPDSMGGGSYGPRGNPGISNLGLVLRVQDTASGLLTRPVLVGRDKADRCVDDYESAIPECEWVGHVWPHPFPQDPIWKVIQNPSRWSEPLWGGLDRFALAGGGADVTGPLGVACEVTPISTSARGDRCASTVQPA